MTSPLLNASIDALSWFVMKAGKDRKPLTQAKAHCLLYLAQSYYAVVTDGDKLLPSVFVAGRKGPVEPNLMRFCRYLNEAPAIEEIPQQGVMFLDAIWRKYGAMLSEELVDQVRSHPPFVKAYSKGRNSEISLRDMADFYASKHSGGDRADNMKVKKITKGEQKDAIMRTNEGRLVKTRQWQPRKIN